MLNIFYFYKLLAMFNIPHESWFFTYSVLKLEVRIFAVAYSARLVYAKSVHRVRGMGGRGIPPQHVNGYLPPKEVVIL